nr:hypothetical protein [uncultured Flavonifractor sp.]
MNLKEAFRFQNKLQSLMDEAEMLLEDDRNITEIKVTALHKKVMPEKENETTVEVAPSEYADRINDVAAFLLDLLSEREKLSRAIRAAKSQQPVDMDSEVSLNGKRQAIAAVFRHMVDLRNSEQLLAGGATGYRFNADGNQVSYRCDAKRVVTINYDRNQIRAALKRLSEKADAVSAELDRCLINSEVAYEAPFDVNDSFAAIFNDRMGSRTA